MPLGKTQKTSTGLYTLIIFVALFAAAAAAAVIFYIKSENNATRAATLQNQLNDLATSREQQSIGSLVGAKQGTKSRLGTMMEYVDEMAAMIVGGPIEETSAEVKAQTAKRQFKETLAKLVQKYPAAKEAEPAEAAPAEAAPAETAPAEAPTNEIVELLVKEDFAKVTEGFDETMKTALPAEKLGEVWKATIEQAGAFKKQLGSRQEKELEYDVTFVTCEFEKGNLDVKLVYNDKKQIAGMFIVPTPEDVVKKYQGKPETPAQKPAQENIDIVTADPNTTGLIRIVEKLEKRLGNATDSELSTQKNLADLQKRFDDAAAINQEKEQKLLAEKEKYEEQVNKVAKDYNDLKALLEQTSEQRVKTLMTQLDEEKNNRKMLDQQLLKTEAELKMTEAKVSSVNNELQKVMPPPDSEVAAFKPDGKILLVDNQKKIVHINLGSNDRIYRGLTFAVYDKNAPIPRDGKGKAEIEVFSVEDKISIARIVSSNPKNPIIENDTIANLIWDSTRPNTFVIAGDFDLDGNGEIDFDAVDKLKALIEKWGGKVDDAITIHTDFLLLGNMPEIRKKPTFEETEADPTAMERYENSLKRFERYKGSQNQADKLGAPIFNYERFLYLIGYKTLANRPGAF
jgi:hypothetical protein